MEDAGRHMQRRRADAAARGYQVVAEVIKRTSGRNAEQPTRTQLLTNRQVGVRVAAQRDWLARCGSGDRAPLVGHHGRGVEARSPSETGDGVLDDVVAVRTSRVARIAGRRTRPRRAAPRTAGVEQVLPRDSEEA
jgi:predicted site-specific integrase-resolvase